MPKPAIYRYRKLTYFVKEKKSNKHKANLWLINHSNIKNLEMKDIPDYVLDRIHNKSKMNDEVNSVIEVHLEKGEEV